MPVSEADKLFLCCRKFLVATRAKEFLYQIMITSIIGHVSLCTKFLKYLNDLFLEQICHAQSFLYSMIWTSILERFHPENALKTWSSFNFEPVCLQSPIRSSFHVVQRIDYSGSQIGGISVFSKSNTLKDFMLVLQWSLFDPCLWGEYKMNYTNTNEWTLVRLTASLA